MSAWIKTILLLPFNVLVIIPALTLWLTGWRFHVNHLALTVTGGVLLAAGLSLAAWTMRLFDRVGQGTAAPWNPPKKLVVRGPYRHVRNPMITSVLVMLLAEALLLNSWAVAVLFLLFWLGNVIYFPLVEEKTLRRRFGDDYALYKKNVPRWIPRPTPWSLPESR
ncbi:MAG: isoprenylcysteine carboxylmethyltransferase family protein [Verrucomicrobiales bacterium]|jgi:protein-S-isoprenylcysteine O-methyltransferase Ste14|nr:isoprenylcysteine carboxylmethyltransferase family protein [Verrucomicrobiales bacterium]